VAQHREAGGGEKGGGEVICKGSYEACGSCRLEPSVISLVRENERAKRRRSCVSVFD
jgi:hypothetical protein